MVARRGSWLKAEEEVVEVQVLHPEYLECQAWLRTIPACAPMSFSVTCDVLRGPALMGVNVEEEHLLLGQ